jgi:hypothetical protein
MTRALGAGGLDMRSALGALLAFLLGTSVCHAQASIQNPAYRYVDERGVIHWAQSLHLVPPAYASRAITPTLGDPRIFPTPRPYTRPPTPTVVSVTIDHHPRLASLHGRYADEVSRLVGAAWKGRGHDGAQPAVAIYVGRDGRFGIPDIERSSGDFAYDLQARDTLIGLRRLPPLPADFTGSRLLLHVGFAHVR